MASFLAGLLLGIVLGLVGMVGIARIRELIDKT